MADWAICSLCNDEYPRERTVERNSITICDVCIYDLVDELAAARSDMTSSSPLELRQSRMPRCTLCDAPAEELYTAASVSACTGCAIAMARIVLNRSRNVVEEIWGIELPEATNVRRTSESLAVELPDAARRQVRLAIELADNGDLGEALTEASLAIISDPHDQKVVEQAIGVLLGHARIAVLTLRDEIAKLKAARP